MLLSHAEPMPSVSQTGTLSTSFWPGARARACHSREAVAGPLRSGRPYDGDAIREDTNFVGVHELRSQHTRVDDSGRI